MDVVLVQIQDHVVEIKEEDGFVVKEDSWESENTKGIYGASALTYDDLCATMRAGIGSISAGVRTD